MGGGRGGWVPKRKLRGIEEFARKTIRAAVSERPNVFISFAYEDLAKVNMLRGQARNDDVPFDFSDWSLNEPFNSRNAEYIREGIRERIRQSSMTLVFVSNNSSKSKWVDWEIRESIRLGKGVRAVYSGDSPPAVLPAAVAELGVKVVPWKHDVLEKEIALASKRRD